MSRNRKPLTLGEKLHIIEEPEKRNGATKASIARNLNIPESSLKTILAKKDSILLKAAKFGLNRKATKDGKYAAMEKALVECEAAVPVDDEPEFANLELPGSFVDYVGADDDVAVCSEVSLDDIIETVRPDTAGTSDEEEMDDAAEASAKGGNKLHVGSQTLRIFYAGFADTVPCILAVVAVLPFQTATLRMGKLCFRR
ncbi:hypothetical protein HPB52_011443 [Rhipicephalus sanguineus]|uniref:HTH psq-type domain-containing protein n=1 Tax=Rhipicephalus sanguineus TaxID=34632 RepID=A0A9D4SNG3_RHISA|nr:hypothetical protein HPB52_011443 [Rhipicephalus sanguineus]